ncbi:hypothetical protein L1987_44904 [Smallanthus sonchifolius]|uniref:Uncharacterized protein n=1 Tax=Smallanthus sonchifolius TaxID=185202 RepID=A0ACB9GQQ7_9ASTR|nr:hypothetical protein L1987_44904 [Smallanthus sonchifolius]
MDIVLTFPGFEEGSRNYCHTLDIFLKKQARENFMVPTSDSRHRREIGERDTRKYVNLFWSMVWRFDFDMNWTSEKKTYSRFCAASPASAIRRRRVSLSASRKSLAASRRPRWSGRRRRRTQRMFLRRRRWRSSACNCR